MDRLDELTRKVASLQEALHTRNNLLQHAAFLMEEYRGKDVDVAQLLRRIKALPHRKGGDL